MRIAVAYENGKVFGHFGHTKQFKLYEVENNEIVGERVVDTNGSGHGALVGFLKDNGVDALICGGIGGGAKTALEQAGIALYGGVDAFADVAVKALLLGILSYNSDATCDHHDHDHGHDCSEHDCSDHDHGHDCSGHGCGSEQ